MFATTICNEYIHGAPTSGDFTTPDQTNSPHFYFSPVGQGAGSDPGSHSSSVWLGNTGSDPGHNLSNLQQDQSDQPFAAWQLDDEMMAFAEGFRTDVPDVNGNSQGFF